MHYLIHNENQMCVFNISRKLKVNLLHIAISRLQNCIKFHLKTLLTTQC